MSSDPLGFFERSIRPIEESAGHVPDLEIDRLLGFDALERERLLSALSERYPPGHWAADRSCYGSTTEQAMQLLSAGLCMLRNSRFEGGHPLECCTRLVNAPTLSPYIRKDGFNYVIVPVGFISAIERYVSSTYAIATVAASWKDPERATILWDQDFFLGSIALLADADVHVFTRGVIEASLEASMQQVVEDFPDLLTFSAFNRELHDRMMEMMPAASDWRSFGYVNLEEALARHRDIRRAARKIARLAVCFAICHEFGHVFTSTVDAEGAQDLSTIETFTDMMGSLVFHRLIEAGILPVIVGSEVTDRDFGHAMAAFHSWNLSKALGSLLHNPVGPGTNAMLERLLEVAMRWDGAMSLIQKVWTDQVPALAHLEDPVSVGHMIMNHWGMMTGGMLHAVLLGKGMPLTSTRRANFFPDSPTGNQDCIRS